MITFRDALILVSIALAGSLSGCDCGDDVKLEIVEPVDGATFHDIDDVDPDNSGVQIVVLVATEGLDLGTSARLTVGDVEQDPADVGAGGVVRFEATLPDAGEHTLVARAEGKSSAPVTVTLETGEGECPAIDIVVPADGATLNAADDQDEEPCGEFHHEVVATTTAQTGRTATLFVNGNSIADADVADGSLTFAGASLDSGNNQLEVVFNNGEDTECRSPVVEVTVDCGVSCTISEPARESLGIAQDQDAGEPGMQAHFVVSTDAEDGQEVVLSVDDGDTEDTESVAGGQADFPAVPLAEGEREIQAICSDGAGNEARSARVRFLVDTIAPTITITSPEDGDYVGMSADQDAGREGLQVLVCADTDEDSDLCAAIAGAAPGPDGCASPTDGSACVLVDCNGDVNIEATVTDDADNESTDTIVLRCETEDPVVVVQEPSSGEILNSARDADPGTAGLQFDVSICSDAIGRDAHLFVGNREVGTAEVEDLGVDCDDESLAQPLAGTATLRVTLSEGALALRAEVTSLGGNLGVSPVVDVTVDSFAPEVIWFDPICGDVLGPSDDSDGNIANGIQYTVQARLSEDPLGGAVTLDVTDGMGGQQSIQDPAVPPPWNASFPDATFRSGNNVLSITVEDLAGNVATRTCAVGANEGGQVRITSPAANTVFTASGDGNPGVNGYQGASVTVVADGVADGSWQVCIDPMGTCQDYDNALGETISVTFPEGDAVNDQVTLTARTVSRPGGDLVSGPIVIRVDTLLPAAPTGLSAVVDDVRSGAVHLSFTAPADPTNRRVTSYDVRQSLTAFAGENDGSIVSGAGAPVDPGSAQRLDLSRIPPGATHYFTVRARDAVGNMGASATATTAALPFDVQAIESPVTDANFGFGFVVAGGADVNDDGFDDVIVGTSEVNPANRAYLYYGGAGGLSASPDVTFSAVGASSFGSAVAMMEDFNGDGIGDVAIGDYLAGGLTGIVYVYFGAGNLAAALTAADADVTITSNEAFDFIGTQLSTAGDVDDDGLSDLLIGALGYSNYDGSAYLVRGSNAPPAGVVLPADASLRITGVIEGGLLYTVAPAGDVNRDGLDDILVGTCNTVSTGSAYLFLGEGAAALQADPVRAASEADEQFDGAAGDLGYGCGLGGVGDINGDSRGDVVVGAPYRNGGGSSRGVFFLYEQDLLGAFNEVAEIVNEAGPNPDQDLLGNSVAATLGLEGATEPSVDNDAAGMPDVAVGQYRYIDAVGRINLYWGGGTFADGDVANAPGSVTQPLGQGLTSLGYAGDVDGDGYLDMIMGDQFGRVNGDAGGNRAGRAYLVH